MKWVIFLSGKMFLYSIGNRKYFLIKEKIKRYINLIPSMHWKIIVMSFILGNALRTCSIFAAVVTLLRLAYANNMYNRKTEISR